MRTPSARLRTRVLAVLAPLAVYALSVALLGDWIIDDAGISYAYAHNLARGYGFVAQPDRVPVEGASNFLWVIVLVPFFVLRCFHPIVTARLLGGAFVAASFTVLQRTLRRATGGEAHGIAATMLLAASPPIVIWTASGLENGLTLLLVTLLHAVLVRRAKRWHQKAGVLTALMAMTHPEGPVFLAAAAAVLAVDAAASIRGSRFGGIAARAFAQRFARSFGGVLAGFAALFVPFMGYRLLTFRLLFPQTYYAKRVSLSLTSRLSTLVVEDPAGTVHKVAELARGATGASFGPAIVVAAVAVATVLALCRRLRRDFGVAIALLATGAGAYVALDDDWMGELRFATPAVAFIVVVVVSALFAAVDRVAHLLRARPAVLRGVAAVAVVAASWAAYAPRTIEFARNPPTPFRFVEREFARKLDAYADVLGLEQGSALLADVGAPLYGSRLRIYDLAGLCEPDVVHTLKRDSPTWHYDHPAFFDWVFDVKKPTFITTYQFWTNVSSFDADPRFGRDYVAIDAFEDDYVRAVYHRRGLSGAFVRKDALRRRDDIERLRAAYRPPPLPEPLAERLLATVRAWRGAEPRDVDGLRREADLALNARRANANRAARLLEHASQLAPDDFTLLLARARALDAAERPDEARPVWEALARAAALADAPLAAIARARLEPVIGDPVAALMQRGLDALYTRGDLAGAEQAFRQALTENPTHYGATYQLAVTLDREGRTDEARALWATVLALATSYDDEATANTARVRLGAAPAPAPR